MDCADSTGIPEANSPQDENVLRPLLIHLYAGPIVGIGYNMHFGELITQCNCKYSNGKGAGPLAGFFVEYPVSKYFSVYGGTIYQDFSATFSIHETRLEYSSSGEFVNVAFEKKAVTNISYFGIQAMAKWKTGFYASYVSIGPAITFLVSDHIKETENILTPGFVYNSSKQPQNVFLDQGIPAKRDVRLSAIAAVGYDYSVTPRIIIVPEIGFQLPLTSVTTNLNNWNAAAIQFSIFLKFGI